MKLINVLHFINLYLKLNQEDNIRFIIYIIVYSNSQLILASHSSASFLYSYTQYTDYIGICSIVNYILDFLLHSCSCILQYTG